LIGWRVSDALAALDESMPVAQEQRQAPQRSMEEGIGCLGKMLAGHMLALTRACIIGFLAALALILVGHFLR
jgi:hypothetical protein